MTQTNITNKDFIKLQNVSKQFRLTSEKSFTALSDINLEIAAGQLVAIFGKSGSGKSTLLNLIAGLDQPTGGEISVAGEIINNLSENRLALWRGKNVGIVFQFFQLLPTLTVLENIQLAMDFVGVVPTGERKEKAQSLLELVGIADQADKLPATLSGGEQQRAAIARALANDPPLLLADEPTGNLDSKTSDAVLGLFDGLVKRGKTLIVVTHDEEIASQANSTIRLTDGKLVNEKSFSSGGGEK